MEECGSQGNPRVSQPEIFQSPRIPFGHLLPKASRESCSFTSKGNKIESHLACHLPLVLSKSKALGQQIQALQSKGC